MIGYESATRAYEKGFSEYATVAHLIGWKQPKGTDGVKFLAMHEFTHALVNHEFPNSADAPHGRTFQEVYKNVIELVM